MYIFLKVEEDGTENESTNPPSSSIKDEYLKEEISTIELILKVLARLCDGQHHELQVGTYYTPYHTPYHTPYQSYYTHIHYCGITSKKRAHTTQPDTITVHSQQQ